MSHSPTVPYPPPSWPQPLLRLLHLPDLLHLLFLHLLDLLLLFDLLHLLHPLHLLLLFDLLHLLHPLHPLHLLLLLLIHPKVDGIVFQVHIPGVCYTARHRFCPTLLRRCLNNLNYGLNYSVSGLSAWIKMTLVKVWPLYKKNVPKNLHWIDGVNLNYPINWFIISIIAPPPT